MLGKASNRLGIPVIPEHELKLFLGQLEILIVR